jgi:hypothetical protein
MVKRYGHDRNLFWGEQEDGKYVLYEDYEKLEEENKTLNEKLEAEKLYYEHQIKELKKYCIELGGFFE